MKENIIAVTYPDDVSQDADRLLLVDLTEQQLDLVSKALGKIDTFNDVIFYIWQYGQDLDWLWDKKHKSRLIIFNAEGRDELITGYMAAQPNSCYMGILKSLNKLNVYCLHDVDQVVDILEKKLS